MNAPKQLNSSTHPVGTLDFVAMFWRGADLPGAVQSFTPALTCPMPASFADTLAEYLATPTISFERLNAGEDMVLAIRLKLGTTQVVWLADVLEPMPGWQ
ncbi:hypothetical protein [Cupriavidus pauculus]|uniref:hypothetical protein n=1 Tax=Cupriavidus pauculus TaxID=82633 RepID=UPI0007835413|nr:hypothetical protein [Cupriavidus pauculus]